MNILDRVTLRYAEWKEEELVSDVVALIPERILTLNWSKVDVVVLENSCEHRGREVPVGLRASSATRTTRRGGGGGGNRWFICGVMVIREKVEVEQVE